MTLSRTALVAALGLSAALTPVTAQAAAPPDMPGYQCPVIYEEVYPNGEMQADGQDCTPVNGATMEPGEHKGPFFLADDSTAYVCQRVVINQYVGGRDCAYAEDAQQN